MQNTPTNTTHLISLLARECSSLFAQIRVRAHVRDSCAERQLSSRRRRRRQSCCNKCRVQSCFRGLLSWLALEASTRGLRRAQLCVRSLVLILEQKNTLKSLNLVILFCFAGEISAPQFVFRWCEGVCIFSVFVQNQQLFLPKCVFRRRFASKIRLFFRKTLSR